RGPLGPCPGVYETRCPSRRLSYSTPSTFDMWKNMSLPVPVSMNPKPLSVSRLIVPSAIRSVSSKKAALHCCPSIPDLAAPLRRMTLHQSLRRSQPKSPGKIQPLIFRGSANHAEIKPVISVERHRSGKRSAPLPLQNEHRTFHRPGARELVALLLRHRELPGEFAVVAQPEIEFRTVGAGRFP